MDALHQTHGVLYPSELSIYREQAASLIKACERLQAAIVKELGKTPSKTPAAAGGASEAQDDPFLEEAAE